MTEDNDKLALELHDCAARLERLSKSVARIGNKVITNSHDITSLKSDVDKLENSIGEPLFTKEVVAALSEVAADKMFSKRFRFLAKFYFFGFLSVITLVYAAREPLKGIYFAIKELLP